MTAAILRLQMNLSRLRLQRLNLELHRAEVPQGLLDRIVLAEWELEQAMRPTVTGRS